jgi:hypothetical protein
LACLGLPIRSHQLRARRRCRNIGDQPPASPVYSAQKSIGNLTPRDRALVTRE